MSYPKAFYTMSFLEFVATNQEWFEETMVLDTEEHTASFQTMLHSVWDIYEISGETIGEQKLFMVSVLNQYKDYYIEKLNTYEKEYDFTEDLKDVSSTHTKTLHVDLPNKQIDPDDYYTYPDMGDKADGDMDSQSSGRFIELKNAYYKQIKNIFEEFAKRFRACFLHIY